MTFLKNLAVSLFSFLLFVSLALFGLAFSVRSTALNPDFVTAELDRLDTAAVVREYVHIKPPADFPNLKETISQTISKIEPQIKKQADAAINSVYDYLLGATAEPDLKLTLKSTFLSSDFVTAAVNSTDIAPLIAPSVSRKITQAIPIRMPNLDKYVADTLAASEPSLKQQVTAVSGPVFDYLLGASPTLKASINLEQVNKALKNTLRQAIIDSPPPEYAAIPRDQRGAFFDSVWPTIAGLLPPTYPIDNSLISPDVRADITQGITSTENGLRTAKQYVGYFQQGYTPLLIFIALMVLGIALIVRNVKDIAHRLGIPMLTYGAMEYAGVWVTKYLISSGKIPLTDMPPPLAAWLLQFIDNAMRPLEIFSLTLLIVGAALTVVSFLYKPNHDLKWT